MDDKYIDFVLFNFIKEGGIVMRMIVILAVVMALLACSYMPVSTPKSGFKGDADDGVDNTEEVAYGCLEDSGNAINLDTHEGSICMGRGNLFTLKVTPISYTSVLESSPPQSTTTYAKVQLAILDKDGKTIDGALMMWQQTELQAEVVKGVAVFKELLIPRSLPADAQLYVTGAQLGSASSNDTGSYFDIATLLGSGINFTVVSDYGVVLESLPPQYRHTWTLGYWPQLTLGSVVDWYLERKGSNNIAPAVSKVMQTKVTQNNYVLGESLPNPNLSLSANIPDEDDKEGDEVLKDLSHCYRLITKITTEVASSSENKKDKQEIVAVGDGVGTGCSF